ncbi:MAG: Hpt domain-containing protein, partial [Alphaproteobacteria bacterium]|nr:Hpt domain-containing protein [Alphaproteobacteria bacterium]
MDDLLSEFLTETAESMDTLDLELVKFEQDPNDVAILGNIFRLVHTIKGTCGFLGLPRLESVAHASENVLGNFRDGSLTVSAGAVTLILESLDRIKEILAALEENETEPEGDDSELIGRLNHLSETGEVPGAEDEAPAVAESPASEEEVAVSASDDDIILGDDIGSAADNDELQAIFDATEYKGPGDPMAAKKAADAASSAPAEEAPKASVPVPAAETAPVEKEQPKTTMAAEKKESSGVVQTIRVNVDLLENLMTMVSELVLTRNQLLQILRSAGDSEFNAPLQRLSHVTSELQEGVMKTRMQPIGNAWAKLPRIVRDLSIELKKKIDLQMIGAETELDRQVLDIIKDPLTHMVRNSADHGIEVPEDRVANGKPETGTITLNAFH